MSASSNGTKQKSPQIPCVEKSLKNVRKIFGDSRHSHEHHTYDLAVRVHINNCVVLVVAVCIFFAPSSDVNMYHVGIYIYLRPNQ